MKGKFYEAEFTDYRVRYAAHYENDGPDDTRAAAVAERAAWAMREGDRNMDGSARNHSTRTLAGSPHLTAVHTSPQYAVRALRPVPEGQAAVTDITITHSKNLSVLHALLQAQFQPEAG